MFVLNYFVFGVKYIWCSCTLYIKAINSLENIEERYAEYKSLGSVDK